MPRSARIVLPDLPYHVTHRGNRRGDVFFSDNDRHDYLRRLERAGERHDLAIWAYCLMTNHVHLIVRPGRSDALARAIGEAHGHHALSLHRANGWDGHLWANRYYSAPLDDANLWAAVRYVERNPVRAGLVDLAERYPWSSARAHCGLASDGPLSPQRPFPGIIANWKLWLDGRCDEVADRSLRASTRLGRPVNNPARIRCRTRTAPGPPAGVASVRASIPRLSLGDRHQNRRN